MKETKNHPERGGFLLFGVYTLCVKKSQKSLAVTLLFSLIGLGGGFFAGYLVWGNNASSQVHAIREQNIDYKFIQPLLAVSRNNIDAPSSGYEGLKNDVANYIGSQKKNGLQDASVYFIDYKNGGSFAINKDQKYYPASMLKVVIMIAYLKKAESEPEILNNVLTFAPSIAQSLELLPFDLPTKLHVGETYTVSTLIDKMIGDSDNGAMNTLLSGIEDSYLNQVYQNLGLPQPSPDGGYTISANDYSLFFRVLYNATYLSKDDSEKALSILSTATWKDGLVASLPDGTIIAHKYGEHVNGQGDTIDSVELHDCGIVYPKNGPYLLCVMTKGKTVSNLTDVISHISKMIYDKTQS